MPCGFPVPDWSARPLVGWPRPLDPAPSHSSHATWPLRVHQVANSRPYHSLFRTCLWSRRRQRPRLSHYRRRPPFIHAILTTYSYYYRQEEEEDLTLENLCFHFLVVVIIFVSLPTNQPPFVLAVLNSIFHHLPDSSSAHLFDDHGLGLCIVTTAHLLIQSPLKKKKMNLHHMDDFWSHFYAWYFFMHAHTACSALDQTFAVIA